MMCRRGHEMGEAAFCPVCGARRKGSRSPWVERSIVLVAVLISVVVLGWFVWDRHQDARRDECFTEQLGDVLAGRPADDC
jgi:hypothetical protein